MIVVPLVQIAFGAAALISAGFAIWALLRRKPRASIYVMLTGAFALTFFLTVPGVRWEALAVCALVIAAGAVLRTSKRE